MTFCVQPSLCLVLLGPDPLWFNHLYDLNVSKTKSCTLSKTKQSRKKSLLQGFRPARRGAQGYGSNESLVAHKLTGFYGVYAEVTWLFQLIGCLVVFFVIWIRVAERGNKEVQTWCEQTWHLGIGWLPLLISEENCKFLQFMLSFCFLQCACIGQLHFLPDINWFHFSLGSTNVYSFAWEKK